jgi:ABC-type transport system involved in multi-copper enzyme maturation permease subunit
MFGRILIKEITGHLIDYRFLCVFGLCALLSALGVYAGSANYARQLEDCNAVSEMGRQTAGKWLEGGNLFQFSWTGYGWTRPPSVLSPVVYGMSGSLGQEATIQYERVPKLEASPFESDPVFALFGVLDLAFIVKYVLSLAVILFTYDAVCGEKEGGTLRLCSSYPVARVTIALAKVTGSTVAVLLPFLFAFLLASIVLALSPSMALGLDEWLRIGSLMGVFAVYLAVFAAFGLFVSALTHRRMTSFLVLLGLWTIWLFLVPSAALRAGQSLIPVKSIYELQRERSALRRDISASRSEEINAYWRNSGVGNWDSLSVERQDELLRGGLQIDEKWDRAYYPRLYGLHTDRENRLQEQGRLVAALSVVSPLGAVNRVSMDLAGTGVVQHEQVETALRTHAADLARFIRQKQGESDDTRDLTDLTLFTYENRESVGDSLSRNVLPVLNLALLAVLGFAGAYVAMLRYDVR